MANPVIVLTARALRGRPPVRVTRLTLQAPVSLNRVGCLARAAGGAVTDTRAMGQIPAITQFATAEVKRGEHTRGRRRFVVTRALAAGTSKLRRAGRRGRRCGHSRASQKIKESVLISHFSSFT